jgi:hypothetical protein
MKIAITPLPNCHETSVQQMFLRQPENNNGIAGGAYIEKKGIKVILSVQKEK